MAKIWRKIAFFPVNYFKNSLKSPCQSVIKNSWGKLASCIKLGFKVEVVVVVVVGDMSDENV